jgi:uncharacterized repeat protein (TIGR03803 family)
MRKVVSLAVSAALVLTISPASLLAAAAASAAQQAQSGSIKGTVVEACKRPIADAKVRLRNAQGGVVSEQTTQRDGKFAFTNVAAGSYSLQVAIVTKVNNVDTEEIVGTSSATLNAGGSPVLTIPTSVNAYGAVTVLHWFKGGVDGRNPQTGLIQAADGNFYGTTVGGGSPADKGTVYKMAPNGAITVLHAFSGGTDGSGPANLLQGSDGNFYGTLAGSTESVGAIFKMTPAGAVTVLRTITGGSDGTASAMGLIPGADGFYGTTTLGGGSNYGTVFKVTSAGVVTVLHAFTGGADGANPLNVILASDGNFYGTTKAGGSQNLGTAFKMTPAGAVTVLHSFTGGTDGSTPTAGLIQTEDGNLYGTTSLGGSANLGTVFKMTSAGAVTVLHSFAGGSDGSSPQASLVQAAGGNLYGTTKAGGASNLGTVFKMTPAGAVTVLHSFGAGNDGSMPLAGLLQAKNGGLYGTTSVGGSDNKGIAFEMTPGCAVGPPIALLVIGALAATAATAAVVIAGSSSGQQ